MFGSYKGTPGSETLAAGAASWVFTGSTPLQKNTKQKKNIKECACRKEEINQSTQLYKV